MQSGIPRNLFFMPWNVKKQIVEHTETFTRMSLRKISRDFCEIVDRSTAAFDIINVAFHKRSIVLLLQSEGFEHSIEYVAGNVFSHRCVETEETRKKSVVTCDKNIVERVLLDLWTIIKNPKVSIKEFMVSRDDPYVSSEKWGGRIQRAYFKNKSTFIDFLGQKLKTLNHKLNIELLNLSTTFTESQIMKILPYVKESLPTLWLKPMTGTNFETMTSTALWQQIKEVQLEKNQSIPLQTVGHIQTGYIYDSKATTDELKMLVQNILKQDNFIELTLFSIEYDCVSFADYLRSTANYRTGGACLIKFANNAKKLRIVFEQWCIEFRAFN